MFLGLKKSVKIQNLQIKKEQVIKGLISSNKSINIPFK